ncbi:MAG: alpha/beta hydrolase-fold protein [Akkermansiaceae bacterium]|jgi:enterochelin esterase-like enzyme|nr:alpha/beta hydrolase-fold protein [Akkermansiaceae bacterium]
MKTVFLSIFSCLTLALAQERPEEVSPERARENFARPVVLAADDVRLFPEPPINYREAQGGGLKGRLDSLDYPSAVTGTRRKAQVYLPPGYTDAKKYPVLYLLHGIGGDEQEWTRLMKAHIILDRLMSEGKAVPFITVFPNGRALADDSPGSNPFEPHKAAGFAMFEKDLLDHLIPAVEGRFSTFTDREHRALAGLSMGGGQSLNFGLGHPEFFGSVGAFSAAPNTRSPEQLVPEPAVTRVRIRLLYISCGNKDGLINFSQRTHRYLRDHHVPHLWNVDDHGHDAETWGSNLYHFAQRLFL